MLSYATQITTPVLIADTRERTQSPTSTDAYWQAYLRAIQSTQTSNYLSDREQFSYFSAALTQLLKTEKNWNSYQADPPSLQAVELARTILRSLQIGLVVPERVLPSADGGISLIFSSGRRNRAVIESLNSLEQIVILYDLDGNVETFTWPQELDRQTALVAKLQNHLRSASLASSGQTG